MFQIFPISRSALEASNTGQFSDLLHKLLQIFCPVYRFEQNSLSSLPSVYRAIGLCEKYESLFKLLARNVRIFDHLLQNQITMAEVNPG